MTEVRLAHLVSHPIQYHAPLFRALAAEPGIAFKVFFCSDISLAAYRDPGFGRSVQWDVPLLDGYDHEFLPAFDDGHALSLVRPLNHGLAARLKRERFEVLWVHGYARLASLIAMANARRLGLRVLLRDDATPFSARRGALKRLVKDGFFAGLRPLVDGVLAVGRLNRDYFLGHGFSPQRVFTMPYAVDNDFFAEGARHAAATREAYRAALGLEPGRRVILFAGKLIAIKRPGDLLAAYGRLVAGGRAAAPYLLFAGDGELAPVLRDAAARAGLEGVRFLGFRNQSALPALYDLCDVLVLPSQSETWGFVINEAMCAGAAIIASDTVGAVPDLVEDGGNGRVYPVGDVAALTDALAGVLADEARLAAMGERSRAIVANYSIAADVAALKGALAAVTGRQPA